MIFRGCSCAEICRIAFCSDYCLPYNNPGLSFSPSDRISIPETAVFTSSDHFERERSPAVSVNALIPGLRQQ